MAKEKVTNGGTYWQGQTDAKLEAVSTAVNEIKVTLVRVEEKIDSVRLWRAKVVGIAVAISASVTIAVKLVGSLL